MTPQPPEFPEGSLVHVDGEPAAFVKGMLKAADEAKRPWWKRRPKLRLPEKVTTDPTPGARFVRKMERNRIDQSVAICSCTGCACAKPEVTDDGRCRACRRGIHRKSRLARPQRQRAEARRRATRAV